MVELMNKRDIRMKSNTIMSTALLILLATNVFAGNELLERKNYNYSASDTYSFGEMTDASETFIYEASLDGVKTLRLEFHVGAFPYHAHFDLGNSSKAYENILPLIRGDNRSSQIDTSYLGAIDQNVEVHIYKVMEDRYATELSVNTISGFSTTRLPDANTLVVLANSEMHVSRGGSLSPGFVERSEQGTVNGLEKRVWYYEN